MTQNPAFIQNELDDKDAQALIKNGCKYVVETSNMGCTAGAIAACHSHGTAVPWASPLTIDKTLPRLPAVQLER